jgi:alpha-beta hydrolase superfamily lysophospholipase
LLSLLAPQLGVLQLDASGISRDPEVVRRYSEDPLVYHGKISARSVAQLFAAMETVQRRAGDITLPLLILHGEADSMAAAEGSKLLYQRAASSDKELHIYPGLYHEIFNEPEQSQIFAELLAWLEARCAAA